MAKDDFKIKFTDPEDFVRRFDRLFYLIIGAILVGFLSLLFMVAGIVVDSWRFNSSIYKESKAVELQSKNIEQTVTQQQAIIELLEQMKK